MALKSPTTKHQNQNQKLINKPHFLCLQIGLWRSHVLVAHVYVTTYCPFLCVFFFLNLWPVIRYESVDASQRNSAFNLNDFWINLHAAAPMIESETWTRHGIVKFIGRYEKFGVGSNVNVSSDMYRAPNFGCFRVNARFRYFSSNISVLSRYVWLLSDWFIRRWLHYPKGGLLALSLSIWPEFLGFAACFSLGILIYSKWPNFQGNQTNYFVSW